MTVVSPSSKKNDKRTSNDLQTLNRKAKIEQHEPSINLTSYLMMQKNQLKYMSSNVFENELCTRAFKGTGSTNPSLLVLLSFFFELCVVCPSIYGF
jgi:NAD-specific glutamate dehydrogenase